MAVRRREGKRGERRQKQTTLTTITTWHLQPPPPPPPPYRIYFAYHVDHFSTILLLWWDVYDIDDTCVVVNLWRNCYNENRIYIDPILWKIYDICHISLMMFCVYRILGFGYYHFICVFRLVYCMHTLFTWAWSYFWNLHTCSAFFIILRRTVELLIKSML